MNPDDLFVPEPAGLASASLEIPNKQQISMSEPALQKVKQEDMNLVRNVIYLQASRADVCFVVCGERAIGGRVRDNWVLGHRKEFKFEIFKEDLDLISLVDPPALHQRRGQGTLQVSSSKSSHTASQT